MASIICSTVAPVRAASSKRKGQSWTHNKVCTSPLQINRANGFSLIARSDKKPDDKNVFDKAKEAVSDAVEKLKDATADTTDNSQVEPIPDDPEAVASNRSQPGKPDSNVSFFTNAGPHTEPAYGSEPGKTKRKEMKEEYKKREDEMDGKA